DVLPGAAWWAKRSAGPGPPRRRAMPFGVVGLAIGRPIALRAASPAGPQALRRSGGAGRRTYGGSRRVRTGLVGRGGNAPRRGPPAAGARSSRPVQRRARGDRRDLGRLRRVAEQDVEQA